MILGFSVRYGFNGKYRRQDLWDYSERWMTNNKELGKGFGSGV